MSRRIGITPKIVLLISVLLLSTAAASILLNRHYYRQSTREQLEKSELPLIADLVLAKVDRAIMEPARGVAIAVKNPFLLDWIRSGEAETGENAVFDALSSILDNYGIMGANYASNQTKKYLMNTGTERNILAIADDDPSFSWLPAFRDSGERTAVNVYVGDPDWGTSAYLNFSIQLEEKWSMISIAINLETLAKEMSAMKPGREGAVFMLDGKGLIRFTDDTALVGKPIAEQKPAYQAQWNDIISGGLKTFTYSANGDERMAYVSKVPILNWHLVTEVSLREFEGAMRRTIYTNMLVSLIIIIAGSLLGLVFARSITRPLTRVTERLSLDADTMLGFADGIAKTSDTLNASAREQADVVMSNLS